MKNKLLSQLYESCKKWKTLVLLGAMLLIGINTVYGAAIPAGTTIYVDVSNFSSGDNNYDNNNRYFLCAVSSTNQGKSLTKDDTSGAGSWTCNADTWYTLSHEFGSIYKATISSNCSSGMVVIWSKDISGYGNLYQVNAAKSSAYDGSKTLLTISSGYTEHGDRKTRCFNSTWSTFTICDYFGYAPSAVLSKTNVMFYIKGYCCGNYLINSSKTKADTSYPIGGTEYSYVNVAKTDLSTYDRISNNPGSSGWEGVQYDKIRDALGGEMFEAAGSKSTADAIMASTTATPSNGTLTISTTCDDDESVYRKQLYIQYYIDGTFAGVTHGGGTAVCNSIEASTSAKASTYDISGLSEGSHTLLTILTDGNIFYIGDEDPFMAGSTPSISLEAPSTAVRGNSITLEASTNQTTPTIYYEYSTNSTFSSSVTEIDHTTSTSKLWTVPSGTDGTTYYLRAKIQVSSTWYYSDILTLTAYGKKTIKVKNTNGWATFNSYVYDYSAGTTTAKRENWPGSTTGVTSAGGQWKQVELTSQYTYFILNNGSSSSQLSGETYTYAGVTDGNCYKISSGSGSSLTLSDDDCPTAPTGVTTTAAPTSSTNARMTVAGSISTNGNDAITDYGFYYGTSATPGTKARIATSDHTGSISKEITGLTAGTTYYFKAYATNGQGTSYGDVESYKLPYAVTVSTNTGCSEITNEGTNYTNSAITVTATKATGYTFSSWSTTNGTQTSTSSTETTNTLTFTPSGDNATIQPVYTENTFNVTVTKTPSAGGSVTPTSVTAMGVVTGGEITASNNGGYAFSGWSVTSGSGYFGATGTSTTSATANTKFRPTADATILATFTPNDYTVTLNDNGGSGGDGTLGVTFDAATCTLTNTPAKNGYDFGGYWTNTDGTGVQVFDANGAPIKNASGYIGNNDSKTWIYVGNPTLYAKWTQTVTLDANTDHHGVAGDGSAVVTYNGASSSVSGFSPTTAATGYQLEGFYAAPTGNDKVLNSNGTYASDNVTDYISSGKWSHAGPTTLYAHYTTKTYSITLDKNGSGSSNGSATATYDSNKLTSIIPPTYSGHEVMGYYKEPAKTNLIADAEGNLQPSTSYTDASGNWTSDGNQTLYAKWGLQVPETLKIDGPLVNGSGVWSKCCTMTKKGRTFTYTVYDLAADTYEFCFKNASCSSTALLKPNMAICDQTKNAGNITWADAEGEWHNFTITTTAKYNVTVTVEYGETTARVIVNSSSPAATITPSWYMIGDPFYKASDQSWSTSNHDYPLDHSYRGISKVYYRVVNFKGETEQWFRPLKGNTGYGQSSGSDVAVDLETPYAISAKMDNGTAFKPNGNHQVYCVVDETNSKFWVQDAVTYYTVTIDNQGSHGTVKLKEQVYDAVGNYETTQYAEGETIRVEIDTTALYSIASVTLGSTPVEMTHSSGTKFTGDVVMPGNNATLTVTYAPWYQINYNRFPAVAADAPSVVPNFSSGAYIKSGTSVTFTYDNTPNSGYTWGHWEDNGSNVGSGSTYTTTISEATNISAVYTANNYTVTLDFDEEHQGTTTGATESQSVTYDAATTTVPAPLPGAENGYCFMGYYTESDGGGVKLINDDGTWIESVDGYTDGSKKWVHDGDVTLHAYYQIAEITEIAITGGAIVLNSTSTTVTATVSPEPEGTTTVCWEVQYSDGTPLPSQPTFTPANGRSVTFTSPARSGSYKLQATLITGSTCGSGDELDVSTYAFTVAGEHTVTIQYKCGDVTVQTSASVEGVKPQDWSDEITAPTDPFGYLFSKWVAGDGVTLTADDGETTPSETTSRTIKIKANYDGILTAQYTKKDLIYFKNTMGWSNVYVYFYSDNRYWEDSYWGSGTWTTKEFCVDKEGGEKDCTKPYSGDKHGTLTQLGETDIWYFDFGAIGCADWSNVVFNSNDQNYKEWFTYTELVRRGDLSKGTPMYVPADRSTYDPNIKAGNAKYYSQGYWTNYLGDVTGYTLEIYNSAGNKLLKSVAFTGDENLMPMTAVVDLEAGQTYKYQIKRDYGYYYGNGGTMTYADHGQGTAWEFTNNPWPGMCGLTTASAGDYTFHLTYSQNGSGVYNLRMSVDYPITSGDYRLIYSDDVQTKALVSAVLPKAKEENIASFFVRPAQHPVLKMQKCIGIDGATVTWTDTIVDLLNDESLPSVMTKDTIYNVILTKGGNGTFSHTGTEYYSGNYYIRTDCAGSKWDNYTSDPRNRMTYSEYAAMTTHSDATRDFTHYFVSHANKDTNVKFVIATDYSPNITDTLKQQTNDITYSHVNTDGNIQEAANIRFMWNIRNNQIHRAYLANAKTDGTEYLVLQGQEGNLLDANGYALRYDATKGTNGYNHKAPDNAIQFDDTENFMYEANVKAEPGGRVKLYTTFHEETYYQYGDNNASFDDPHAIELIGGSGGAQSIRVIYDFKTDRLIAAWVPSDETISDTKTINADIMLIREHQEAGKQINLSGLGKIKTDKTVYGVMRFNRYILNNRSTEGEHPILDVSDQKSQYERFNYMISFPFDVKVGEVFGFGTRGNEWRISYYDALGRAQEGFFAERGDNNWRLISSPDSILHANVGYLLQLNYIRLGYNKTGAGEVWANNKEEVELYFPAKNKITSISVKNIDIPALSDDYKCTINLMDTYTGMGYDEEKASEADRRVKDSYWRCIGVPGFTSYEATASSWTNFNWTAEADSIPFIYEWQMDDNSLTVVSTTTTKFTFKSMHAYLLQNGKAFTWTGVAQPHNIVARRAMTADEMNLYEFRLEMQNNEEMLDQTYIRLSNSETVTEAFDFGEDLSKEMNSKYNIYTKVGYERLAANSLPLTEQTTIVPVGVKISTDGTYIFSIPEGTNGVGVILVDEFAGTRTNLALEDYEVNLTAGKIDDRFKLEISPVAQMPTDIELINSEKSETGVRKMLIDGILYIVRDGKIFDAQGKRVK